MRLVDFLGPARVLVPLRARSLSEALPLLLDACVRDGSVRDAARLDDAVAQAWPEDTVSFGPNAFLPHFRTDAVGDVVVALGVAPEPLGAGDGPGEPRGARIVLLVLAPPHQAATYLQLVAAFTRALGRSDLVQALHDATGPADVLGLEALHDISLEGALLVRDIMSKPPLSVSPDSPLGAAAALLIQHNVESVPVVGPGGEVVGVLSNHELLKYLVPSYVQRVNTGESPPPRRIGGKVVGHPRDLPVREAMNRAVLCVSEHQTVSEAASLMANKNVDRLPVVDEGRLTGFLTRADIVRKLIGPL